MQQKPLLMTTITRIEGGTNSQRISRCHKVATSLAALGIAFAASGVLASVLIA